jgi:hypothetical protein
MRETGSNRRVAGPVDALAKHHIAGLECSRTAADTLTVAVGECRDVDDAENMVLSASLAKDVSSAWAVGAAAGSLDTGAYAATTLYYVWLIKRTDTGVVDVLTSVSGTEGTITKPTNYDEFRLIGAFVTDSGPDIINFQQVGNYFRFLGDVVSDVSDAIITADTFEDGILSCPRHSLAHIYVKWSNAAATSNDIQSVTVRTKGAADASNDAESIVAWRDNNSNPLTSSGIGQVLTDTDSTIEYAGSEVSSVTTIAIATLGFTMLTRNNPI